MHMQIHQHIRRYTEGKGDSSASSMRIPGKTDRLSGCPDVLTCTYVHTQTQRHKYGHTVQESDCCTVSIQTHVTRSQSSGSLGEVLRNLLLTRVHARKHSSIHECADAPLHVHTNAHMRKHAGMFANAHACTRL